MEEIIESLKKGYVGDTEKDTKYLLEQMDKYKDNPKVLNEIYKLLFELLPDDLQHTFVRNINQEKFEIRLKEIQELVVNKEYKRALEYLDMSIQHIEPVYEDEKNVYKSFHSPLDAYLYANMREDKSKFVTNSKLDFGVFHKFRGIILKNLGKLEEAEAEFVESFKWNNLDREAIIEYADVLFQLKKYDEFLKFNLDQVKIAYDLYFIAQIYHNIGLYYTTKGTKEADIDAFNIISYSITFAETDYAFRDLNTICEKYHLKKEIAPEEEVKKTFEKEKLPVAPDMDLIKFLIDTARKFIGVNDEFALNTFKIIYAITQDDITKQFIEAGEKVVQEKRIQKMNKK